MRSGARAKEANHEQAHPSRRWASTGRRARITRLSDLLPALVPDLGRPPVRLFNLLVMEPGSLIMERKMLLSIKQRAEDLALR